MGTNSIVFYTPLFDYIIQTDNFKTHTFIFSTILHIGNFLRKI